MHILDDSSRFALIRHSFYWVLASCVSALMRANLCSNLKLWRNHFFIWPRCSTSFCQKHYLRYKCSDTLRRPKMCVISHSCRQQTGGALVIICACECVFQSKVWDSDLHSKVSFSPPHLWSFSSWAEGSLSETVSVISSVYWPS